MKKILIYIKLLLNKGSLFLAHLIPFLSLIIPKLKEIQENLKFVLKNWDNYLK